MRTEGTPEQVAVRESEAESRKRAAESYPKGHPAERISIEELAEARGVWRAV